MEGEPQGANMRTDDGTGESGEQQMKPVRIWLTRSEACDMLGIGVRALQKRVVVGKVERRKVGRECRYRILHVGEQQSATRTESPNQRTGGANGRTGTVTAFARKANPEQAPLAQQSELPELAQLIQQLTDDLGKAREEKGEAVGIGWMLLSQQDEISRERDQLAARLTWLQRQLMRVSDSALSLPVRRHLRKVLRQSIH